MAEDSPRNAQRRASLAVGNVIRKQRSDFKKLLLTAYREQRHVDMRTMLCSLIAKPPPWAHSWRVHQILNACPGFHQNRIAVALEELQIPPLVQIAQLAPSSRLALVEYLHPDLEGAAWIG